MLKKMFKTNSDMQNFQSVALNERIDRMMSHFTCLNYCYILCQWIKQKNVALAHPVHHVYKISYLMLQFTLINVKLCIIDNFFFNQIEKEYNRILFCIKIVLLILIQ